MPLAKHRPNFSELIVIAAQQRQKIDNKQRDIFDTVLQEVKKKSSLRRTISRSSTVSPVAADESTPSGRNVFSVKGKNEIYLSTYLMYSTRISSFLNSIPCKTSRFLAVALAACSLTIESSTNKYSTALYFIDMIIDIHFIFFGLLKILSWYAKSEIKRLVHRKIEYWDLFKYSGLSDTIFSTLSLSFGHSYIGQWFRLIRLLAISTVSLQQLPHIDVLVSGITIGVKSLISTWLLLTLVFFVFAAWSYVLFGNNDPAHFGSMAMSIWTLFQFSTMDNWGEILYINMYGCNHYPSDYVPRTNSSLLKIQRYGDMFLPVCSHPEARPILASMIFISFILLCGFILVSLTVASVTTGINERLKDIDIEGEEHTTIDPSPAGGNESPSKEGHQDDHQAQSGSGKQPPSTKLLHLESASRLNSPSSTPNRNLLTHREMLLMVLIQLWRKEELYVASTKPNPDSFFDSRRTGSSPSALVRERNQSFKSVRTNQYFIYRIQSTIAECSSCLLAFRDFDLQAMSIHMRALTNHPLYKYFLAITISFAALIEILVLEKSDGQMVGTLRIFQILLQIYFTFDIFFQIMSHYPACESFFINRWNQYDVLLIVITWIPTIATGLYIQKYLVLLRVLRILRLLRLLSWIPELNIIMRAISSSAVALFYVVLLVFLFFFHFAIAGVLLFKRNDPQHFTSFFRAMVSLFQIATLDNWSDVARINMYGCDFYGYDTGDLEYDSQCENPVGLGWFAAWYFALFIVFGVFVLISLFVGVIITSMELLREGIQEENEVWKKVKLMQKSHTLDDASIDNLLEIFNLVDTGQNGKLTFHELKPLLELVSITEADQHQVFVMVDTDKSGQVDFAEFIQLVYHMGTRYKEIRTQNLTKSRRNDPSAPKQPSLPQEPRRLSRAGEEYFALLAEDRLRSEKEKINYQHPSSGRRGNEEMTSPPVVDAAGFSDLKLLPDEGKSEVMLDDRDDLGADGHHPDSAVAAGEDHDEQENDNNSSCSSEDHNNIGMISPLGGRQSLYTLPS